MPAKGTRLGSCAPQPLPFAVFRARNGGVGVRVGTRRAYVSVREVNCTAAGLLHITATKDGLLLEGEGVVRELGDVVVITA